MKKLLRYTSWVGVALVLLGLASCNLPGFGTRETGVKGGSATPTVAKRVGPTNTDGAETIRIPGGTFQMGSSSTDKQAEADEQPSHQVTLDTFYIYTHEVTNKMYAACVKAGACLPVDLLKSGPTSHANDPAFAEHPVVGVDWLMARDYCDWAKGRLPTEAEWELAARGVKSLTYPWGEEEPTCDRVNMLGCLVPPNTVKVGSFKLGNSPYEVWDMAGNVWEWVHDWYDKDYYFLSPDNNPIGPYYSELKAVRGGGLFSEPVQMRSAARQAADPHRPYDDVGFRCVAASGLDLPDGYFLLETGHTRVPPASLDGGGEPVEDYDPDPETFLTIGRVGFSCPESDGSIALWIEYSASAPVTASVSVDRVPFVCSVDPGTGDMRCDGPTPAAYGHAPAVQVDWHFEGDGISQSGTWTILLPLPERCGSGDRLPVSLNANLGCPFGGRFNLTIIMGEPVTFDYVRQVTGGGEVGLSCGPIVGNRMTCLALDSSEGGFYTFDVKGVATADGFGFEYPRWRIPVREDCPADPSDVMVNPYCDLRGGPGVQVTYPWDELDLASVEAEGLPLTSCMEMAPGVEFCGYLSDPAGSTATVTTCFTDRSCRDWTITVPDCGGETPPWTLNYGCSPYDETMIHLSVDTGYAWLVGGAHFSYRINDGETDYGCSVSATVPGQLSCSGRRPASPGPLQVCIQQEGAASATCHTWDIWPSLVAEIPPCGEVPSGDNIQLATQGCHSETMIYFIITSNLEWLVRGASFRVIASDGETRYTCEVHPTMPGQMYCSGVRPTRPGPLTFCVQRVGEASPHCQTFDSWPMTVDEIPSCLLLEPAEPLPATIPSCADYTTPLDCDKNKAQCRWVSTPAPGHCEANP